MSDSKLSSDGRYQVRKIRSMTDEFEHRAISVVDRLPVRAVHLCVVEVLALDAPGLAKDLRPLGAWFDQALELSDVDRAITNLCRPIGGDDPPASTRGTAASLIQQLLLVRRERVRPNALEERSGRAFLQLIALQSQSSSGTAAGHHRFSVIERPGRSRNKVTVVSRRYSERQDPLTDACNIDAHRWRSARFVGL